MTGLVRGAAVAGFMSVALVSLSGCGDSKGAAPLPSGSSPRTEIEYSCSDATLSVPKGRQLDFTSCGAEATATVTVTVTDPDAVLSRLSSLVFIARAVGHATIEISRGPACSPGEQCSQARTTVARMVVDVS
jgi:hypothetical protein